MKSWEQQQAIIRAAQDAGIDPNAALAIAERESNFDPYARSSKTIRGMYQMTGNLRQQYGIGDSSDPETQARGWAIFFKDNKGEMARVLGRDPTDAEGYLGHHFGSVRAARMMRMDPNTPVDQVFTPYEMSVNPHFARAGTVGRLNASVMADINQRQARFGGGIAPPDLAEYGTPVDDSGPDYQGNFDRNKKWAKSGNYRTDLGDKEAEFQKWVQDNKIPFDVKKTGPDDYDMRGFWKGAQEGDPRANTSPNPNDHQIHYDDKWKTPYHKSFSNESQWAKPNAPTWNDKDQLIDPATGGVVYDEKAPAPAPQPQPQPQPQSRGPVEPARDSGNGPMAFIVHHTGGRGDPANVVADWRANRPGVGAQYIMDRDGVIHDTAAEYGYGGHGHMITGSGAGAGLHNGNTVGMEVVARDNNDVTPAQIAAGHAFIQKNYPNVPVYGHGEVNPGHREADEGMGIVNSVRGERAHPVDLSQFGTVASQGPDPEPQPQPQPQPQPSAPVAQSAPDLGSLGTPVA